jgi:hypothetical protein
MSSSAAVTVRHLAARALLHTANLAFKPCVSHSYLLIYSVRLSHMLCHSSLVHPSTQVPFGVNLASRRGNCNSHDLDLLIEL